MKKIFFLAFAVVLFSCSESGKNGQEKFDFPALAGDWHAMVGEEHIVERWTVDGKKMSGTSFSVQGSDMTVQETISLENLEGTPVYIPKVPNQNDGKAIPFTCAFQNKHRIDFENRLHDFPQVIRYEFITPDSIDATISTYPLEGSDKKMVFHFTRKTI